MFVKHRKWVSVGRSRLDKAQTVGPLMSSAAHIHDKKNKKNARFSLPISSYLYCIHISLIEALAIAARYKK